MRRLRVLITGASGDIGLALYNKLYADGRYELYLHFRNQGSYRRVRSQIKPEHTTLLFADLCDKTAVKQLAAGLPVLDILVNNAGNFEAGSFFDTPLESIERQLQVNYLSPLVLTHHVAKKMQQNGGGRIINLSSGSGNHKGLLPSFGYAAGKNGLSFMTQALAKELGPEHIIIVAVVLRFVQTRMLETYSEYYEAITGKKLDVGNVDTQLTLHSPHTIAEKLCNIISDDSLQSGDIIEIL
ncbi:MAG TPA: SDR family oxidoreductase [Candidatus Saccharimonadales bacterium]